MIPASHSPLHIHLLTWYYQFILKKDFKTIAYHWHTPQQTVLHALQQNSLLLIGNHFSWWDGFIAHHLASQVFHKKFYVMMLEAQLKKYMWFAKCGAFSVHPKHKEDVQTSLQYASNVLQTPQNALVFFPQGKLQSLYHPEPQFKPGLSTILPHAQVTVLYCALPEWYQYRKPTLHIHLQVLPNVPQSSKANHNHPQTIISPASNIHDALSVQQHYIQFRNQCIVQQDALYD
jgi:1-acyl-sn-glycerol-3-phosphate acyltransferase